MQKCWVLVRAGRLGKHPEACPMGCMGRAWGVVLSNMHYKVIWVIATVWGEGNVMQASPQLAVG